MPLSKDQLKNRMDNLRRICVVGEKMIAKTSGVFDWVD